MFAFHAVSVALLKHFGAYIQRNVAAGHEKTARCCEENGLKELSPDGVMRRRELDLLGQVVEDGFQKLLHGFTEAMTEVKT